MKKVGLILILFIMSILPCNAKPQYIVKVDKISQKSVFIYHIPDEDSAEQASQSVENPPQDIVSDDVTADTSPMADDEDEIGLIQDTELSQDYEINEMYSDVLQGYAQYDEEEENTIALDDFNEEFLKLDLRKPFFVKKDDYTSLKTSSLKFYDNQYSRFTGTEYNISPKSSRNYRTYKGFSAGTLYNEGIDYGEWEQSSGVFSRYQYKRFAINTAYMKTVNTTNNNYNDNFYFSPEWNMNQYFSLRPVLSADITRNRTKAEVILSINPYGNKDTDRLRFELGANQTYDDNNAVIKSQVKFNTRFKL